jgi:hypothetical protein
MFLDYDMVVLVRDVPERRLRAGDVGTVVQLNEGGAILEVEFVTGDGEQVALVTLASSDVRAMTDEEILHVRLLS